LKVKGGQKTKEREENRNAKNLPRRCRERNKMIVYKTLFYATKTKKKGEKDFEKSTLSLNNVSLVLCLNPTILCLLPTKIPAPGECG